LRLEIKRNLVSAKANAAGCEASPNTRKLASQTQERTWRVLSAETLARVHVMIHESAAAQESGNLFAVTVGLRSGVGGCHEFTPQR
jgi:hypothetical protein